MPPKGMTPCNANWALGKQIKKECFGASFFVGSLFFSVGFRVFVVLRLPFHRHEVKERQPLQLTVDAAGDCRAAVASEAQLKAAASGAGGTAGSGSAKPKLGECLGGRGETAATCWDALRLIIL